MPEKNGVSIIICCYNSIQRLPPTLQSLQNIRTTIAWEVILVDNASTDSTAATAKKIWDQNPLTVLKIVNETNPGLMNARKKGVESSSFSIISFIDDDNSVEPLWIDKIHSIMQKDVMIGACGGRSEGIFAGSVPDWFSAYASSFAVGKQQSQTGFVEKKKGFLWGAGLSLRRLAWDDLYNSGFTSLLKGRKGKSLTAGEDSEMCLALNLRGWKLWYDDSLVLKHYLPESRITLSYLERMVSGFGKAEVVLSVYRDALNSSTSSKSSWLMQLLASVKNLSFTLLKKIFSSRENKIKNKLSYKHDKAYVTELFFSRKKYYSSKKQILNIINLKTD